MTNFPVSLLDGAELLWQFFATELFFSCSTLVNIYPDSILFLQSTNNLVASHVMNPGRGCLQRGGTTPRPLTLCPSTTWGPRLLETSTRLSGMTMYPNSMPSSSELSLTRNLKKGQGFDKLRDANFFIFRNRAFKLLLGDDHWI